MHVFVIDRNTRILSWILQISSSKGQEHNTGYTDKLDHCYFNYILPEMSYDLSFGCCRLSLEPYVQDCPLFLFYDPVTLNVCKNKSTLSQEKISYISVMINILYIPRLI